MCQIHNMLINSDYLAFTFDHCKIFRHLWSEPWRGGIAFCRPKVDCLQYRGDRSRVSGERGLALSPCKEIRPWLPRSAGMRHLAFIRAHLDPHFLPNFTPFSRRLVTRDFPQSPLCDFIV